MAVRLITIDMDIMTRRVVSIKADHGADDDNARRAATIAVNSNDHRGKNTIAMRPLTRGPTLAVKQGSRNVVFFAHSVLTTRRGGGRGGKLCRLVMVTMEMRTTVRL